MWRDDEKRLVIETINLIITIINRLLYIDNWNLSNIDYNVALWLMTLDY